MHQTIIGEAVHPPGFGAAGFQFGHRFGHRHLIDQDLVFPQRLFGNAVAGLDHRCLRCPGGGGNTGGAGEEAADGHGVGGVVGALVDHLQHVICPQHRRRHLDAAGAPAIGQRHFARSERHLVAGNGDRLQQGPADHPLGLFVQIGEVVTTDFRGHGVVPAASISASRRMSRMFSSSL